MTEPVGIMRRITRELRDVRLNQSDLWTVNPVDDTLKKWEGEIHGIDDKRHRCRKYKLSVTFPEAYPFKPPTVRFIDHVRCENVCEDGTICIDILGSHWSPALTISKVMESIVSVLTDAPVTGLINKPKPQTTSVVKPLHLLNTSSQSNSRTQMPAYGTGEFWRWAQERKRNCNENRPEIRNIMIRT